MSFGAEFQKAMYEGRARGLGDPQLCYWAESLARHKSAGCDPMTEYDGDLPRVEDGRVVRTAAYAAFRSAVEK